MTTQRERAVRNLLGATAAELTTICRRPQNDVLERNLAIGDCLLKRLKPGPTAASKTGPSLRGDGFIDELAKRDLGLGKRLLYHCCRLAAQKLPADVWARMKATGVSWRTARDIGRLIGTAKTEADRNRTLVALMKKLPRAATVKAKRDFQNWLDEQLYPLSDKARYIVLDRVSGRVFSTKLKTSDAAKELVERCTRVTTPSRIRIVKIRKLR